MDIDYSIDDMIIQNMSNVQINLNLKNIQRRYDVIENEIDRLRNIKNEYEQIIDSREQRIKIDMICTLNTDDISDDEYRSSDDENMEHDIEYIERTYVRPIHENKRFYPIEEFKRIRSVSIRVMTTIQEFTDLIASAQIYIDRFIVEYQNLQKLLRTYHSEIERRRIN